MQKVFAIFLVTLSLVSYGQQKRLKSFKLVVLKPDTAVIDKSLYGDIDSIVATQQNSLFELEKEFDSAITCEGCDTLFNDQIKTGLANMKALDEEMKEFKYYQFISFYSVFYYYSYFNESSDLATIVEFPYQNTNMKSLKLIADSSQADYIVFFDNIHTEIKGTSPVLKLETSLYSRQEQRIILLKETEGDTKPFGGKWNWHCNNTLSKLLINGIKTSTAQVVPEIEKRQIMR